MSDYRYVGPADPYDADVRVEMGQWAQAADDQSIGTVGLGSCIGLAVFDPKARVGYMAHTVGHEPAEIEEMLRSVASSTRTPAKLNAWLCGGELTKVDPVDEKNDRIRGEVLKLIVDAGIARSNLEVSWNDSPDDMVDMLLDTKTGRCTIIRESIDDYIDYDDDLDDDF